MTSNLCCIRLDIAASRLILPLHMTPDSLQTMAAATDKLEAHAHELNCLSKAFRLTGNTVAADSLSAISESITAQVRIIDHIATS